MHCQPIVGSGSIVARITSSQNGGQAGVMISSGPTPSAANVAMLITGSELSLGTRASDGAGGDGGNAQIGASTPYWVKAVWDGTFVRGYYSPDGVDWTQAQCNAQPCQVTLNAAITTTTLYAGLVVSSSNTATSTSATFDNVTLLNANGTLSGGFSLGLPAGTQTINAGQSLSLPINVSDFGVSSLGVYSTSVALTVTGLPTGVSAQFSPSTVSGSGSAILIITSSPSTATGTYPLTVTASAGGTSHQRNVNLLVSPTTQAPSPLSLSPASGSGASQLFTLEAYDSIGVGGISWVEILVNNTLNEPGACYLHYDQATNITYLRDDSNPTWVSSGVLGGTSFLSNSQCALNLGESSFSASGNTLTLNLALTFQPVFAGSQKVYTLVGAGTTNSRWRQLGTWTVP
jgi:hypothetical protein